MKRGNWNLFIKSSISLNQYSLNQDLSVCVDDQDCNGAFFSKNPFANSRVIHILGIRKNDLRSSFSNSPSNYIALM